MEKQKKKLDISCVNKIKYEGLQEFSASIFESVYLNAYRRVNWIIGENEKIGTNDLDDEFCTEEQLNNIIPFLGERGRGKSSAMLSFALFLKNYCDEEAGQYKFKTQKTTPHFCVMQRIDVAMMVKGENIMELILAQMWDKFETKYEKCVSKKPIYEETKKAFIKLKDSFEIYEKAIYGKERVKETTSVRELHELAKCMNLQKDFKKLVECYLACMSNQEEQNNYLVITIDDLDVTTEDSHEILEQIRLFLMIPKVIVLVTADISRLFLEINKSFSEKHICALNKRPYEETSVRDYVKKYLAKVFPGNMRIMMPELGGVIGVPYEIEMQDYIEVLYENKQLDNMHFDEKRFLFAALAKGANILCYPFVEGKHLLQKESLRALVNNLHVVIEIISLPNNRNIEEQLCQWLFGELKEYSQGNGMEYFSLMNMYVAEYDIAHSITLQMKKMEWKIGDRVEIKNYGELIKMLLQLDDDDEFTEEEIQLLTLFYSLFLARRYEETFLKNNVLGETIKYYVINEPEYVFDGSRINLEEVHGVDSVLRFKLKYNSKDRDIKKVIIDNLDEISEIFKLANIYDVNIWKPGERYYERFEAEEHMNAETEEMEEINMDNATVQESVMLVKVWNCLGEISVDNLIFNMLSYDTNVRGICENVYDLLCEEWEVVKSKEEKKADIDGIMADKRWKLEEYYTWKRKYNVNSFSNLLPIQSVDVMYHLVKTMKSKVDWSWYWRDNKTFEALIDIKNIIISELDSVENYIEYEKMGYRKYSEILSEYFEILSLESIRADYRKRMEVASDDSIGLELPRM